ncbi:Gag protein [Phytophthora palmivora]|uniref:Gag protein n=1 Tax=Phytophthora palmivora TaxID=4796 RepID=A0A2P4WXZ1_9STRA|nr:Gag protein [Phytophthora palmivora]
MSISSARASLPVNKGSVSYMSTFTRIQEMRVLAASLMGNHLPEHIKVTVFMDGLKVGPSRTQLFRVDANTMEEAIQIALQEEYIHRQARTPTSVWQGHNASSGTVHGAPAAGASTGPVPMELGTAVQSSIRCYRCGKLGHIATCLPSGRTKEGREGTVAEATTQEPGELGSTVGSGRPTGEDLSPHGRIADGARHGGLAPKSLGALEARKYSGGPLVVHVNAVARNSDKYADALRETEGRGQASRWYGGKVLGVRMDLAVKFEGFDSTESSLVLDMGKYDLILSMPWPQIISPGSIGAAKPLGLAGLQSPTEHW